MKKLNVPGMMCAHCVKRITSAMEAAKINATVDLATKTVTVPEADVAKVTEILDDLGFDAN